MKKTVFVILCVAFVLFGFTACQPRYVFFPFPDYDSDKDETYIPNIKDNDEFEAVLANLKSGDKVELRLASGGYNAQVNIPEGAEVTIIGAGENQTILNFPESNTDLESLPASEADTSTTPYIGVIMAKDASITLKDLTVASNPEKNYEIATQVSGNSTLCNLIAINSSVHAENVTFTDSYFAHNTGVQNGIAIYLVGDGTNNDAYFKKCSIKNFNKCGLLAREGVKSLTFIEGEILGDGHSDQIAQNGIQISCADYEITGNEISFVYYDGPNWSATGILMVPYGSVSYTQGDADSLIAKNSFSNCQQSCTIYGL